MQISSRFTIVVHMLCYIALFQDKEKVTSDIMAGSINANPVVVKAAFAAQTARDGHSQPRQRRSFSGNEAGRH